MELDKDQKVDDQPREFMIVAQECEEKPEDVIVPICPKFIQELQSQKTSPLAQFIQLLFQLHNQSNSQPLNGSRIFLKSHAQAAC